MTFSWDEWASRLAGAGTEDLSQVLTHVRLKGLPETRAEWANDPRTRDLLHLGLHLLYVNHIQGGPSMSAGALLFKSLSPGALETHAADVIEDPAYADSLDANRFKETWGNTQYYIEDLLAYLFRPKPYLDRIRQARAAMAEMVVGVKLGDFVRAAAAAELEECVSDPVLALQTLVQASLPWDQGIRAMDRRLEAEGLQLWADLYAAVLPAYGLHLREGVTWMDLAELFTTVTDGALLRRRIRGEHPRLSNQDDMLAGAILAMLPSLLKADVEGLQERLAMGPADI